MKRLFVIVVSMAIGVVTKAQHPVTFFTKAELPVIKNSLRKYPLLADSYADIKKEVDQWLDKEVDVPFPKDPAGGYTHDRHKANYMLMFNSGILYNITGDAKYALLVKKMLLKYAVLNPTLKKHPQATSSSPGHIFWQALNDANWLVYTGMAYDLIYNSLSATERTTIEQGAFKPEVDFFTKDLAGWFDLIHNHGVWACAGVGIAGIATGNKDWVDMALYGTDKKGKSGFIAQMNGLFSPDGYYTEGPYYVRYAILPYYLFANALNHARPELKIFQHRDNILQKALLAGLQQTNLDGTFFPLNDAMKEKDFTSNELVSAINIAWDVYGKNEGFLTVAKKQDRVLINKGGASIAAAIESTKNTPAYFPYKTIEYTDGVKGDEGGVSFLRNGKAKNTTTLIYKYTSHGLSHGHFDKLNINLFDKGNEILSDYGSVRFIGVEQKYGGRYLPENKTYAEQTIAHNTITVDETTQFNGKEEESQKYHSDKLFSDIKNKNLLAVSAKEDNAYEGVHLQRNIYMLQLPDGRKFIADIFNAASKEKHQYDLPFQYSGTVISTSFKYDANTKKQEVLGKKNGYQFLWKEAEAAVKDPLIQFTFLNKNTYYSISSAADTAGATLFFTRTGANDPNFNLRREPAFIIRKSGMDKAFISMIEIHGNFDPVAEFSSNSYSSVKAINVLRNDEQYSVVEVLINDKKLLIAQCNNNFNASQKHQLTINDKRIEFNGPYQVTYDGKLF